MSVLEIHEFIVNAVVRTLRGVFAAMANRILVGFVADEKLVKYCEGGHWAYILMQQPLLTMYNTFLIQM